jgi:hypothetical protein
MALHMRASKYNYITKELFAKTIAEHKTIAQVAAALGCSAGTVNNLRIKFAIDDEPRTIRDPETKPLLVCRTCRKAKPQSEYYYLKIGRRNSASCKICVTKNHSDRYLSMSIEERRAASSKYIQSEKGKQKRAEIYQCNKFADTVGLSAHEQPELFALWQELRQCQQDYRNTKHSIECPTIAQAAKEWSVRAFNFLKTIKQQQQNEKAAKSQ